MKFFFFQFFTIPNFSSHNPILCRKNNRSNIRDGPWFENYNGNFLSKILILIVLDNALTRCNYGKILVIFPCVCLILFV